jgi:hypothetical protein
MKNSDFKHVVKESLRVAFFKKSTLLNESMNLYIKGADYTRLDSLGEISHRLQNAAFHFLSTLPQDQQDYWKKNHAFPTYEIITPDGPYYDESVGIMNFYISGLTRQALVGMLKVIFAKLKQMGINWGKIKTEQSGTYQSQVIRIPILKNPHAGKYSGPPELNMSNVNAYQIFHNVLQYEGEHDFSMKAKELMERIQALAQDQGWIDKNTIQPTDSAWPKAEYDPEDIENPHLDLVKQIGDKLGGARMIGGGLSGDKIRYRLGEIWEIAKWADDHGFEDLYVS